MYKTVEGTDSEKLMQKGKNIIIKMMGPDLRQITSVSWRKKSRFQFRE